MRNLSGCESRIRDGCLYPGVCDGKDHHAAFVLKGTDGRVLTAVADFSGDLLLLCSIGGRQCHSGRAVWELDPKTRRVAEAVADTCAILRTATSALHMENYILIGSMDDDRIGVFRRN